MKLEMTLCLAEVYLMTASIGGKIMLSAIFQGNFQQK
jgi:hypothetical protein